MELYQLAYFLEIARQKNFTRAAERLRIAQPALSQQMKNLEAELGAALFVRGRKQTLLTAAGEALAPRAEALLAQAEAAKQTVAEVADLRGGRLVVATIPSVSACWLPAVIRGFRKAHPQVELRLIEESSEGVAELVKSGQAELGLLQMPVNDRIFEHVELLSESFVVLLSRGHPLARKRSIRLEALAGENFIFYKGRARDSALAACREAGFEPATACASGQLETIRALVEAGLGIAIVPRLAARDLPSQICAIDLDGQSVMRKIALINARKSGMSAAARKFSSLVTQLKIGAL